LDYFVESDRNVIKVRLGRVGGKFTVGVKRMIYIAEMACQDVDKVEKFVETMEMEYRT
jgi:hypothetical protein